MLGSLFLIALLPLAIANEPRPAMPPSKITLAIKLVAFRDAAGNPTITREDSEKLIADVNSRWQSCNVNFRLEHYLAINPSAQHLPYEIANYSDLTDIRGTFSENSTLLVVSTGAWRRTGSLGNSGANAWTSMPESAPFGTVVERPFIRNANLIAHELGHYLNLYHVPDGKSLMAPVLYPRSTALSEDECATARSAALSFWHHMLR